MPHATESVSTWTIGDAAKESLCYHLVSYGRGEPSLPLLVPRIGFVSGGAASKFSSLDAISELAKRSGMVAFRG